MESSNTFLRCERCNSNNVQVQLLNQIDLVPKRKSFLWWVTIGWLWTLIKWIVLYALLWWYMLVVKILAPKKYKTRNRVEKFFVCNACGHHWKS